MIHEDLTKTRRYLSIVPDRPLDFQKATTHTLQEPAGSHSPRCGHPVQIHSFNFNTNMACWAITYYYEFRGSSCQYPTLLMDRDSMGLKVQLACAARPRQWPDHVAAIGYKRLLKMPGPMDFESGTPTRRIGERSSQNIPGRRGQQSQLPHHRSVPPHRRTTRRPVWRRWNTGAPNPSDQATGAFTTSTEIRYFVETLRCSRATGTMELHQTRVASTPGRAMSAPPIASMGPPRDTCCFSP